ncbi:MAG: AAA family ATPase, partial [Blautia sp.]|nr:AAA family ATPase [Blautia sp.]
MGIYLNPGRAAYEEAINSDIFVDKTEMIGFLNSVVKTKQKYVSVSRPRRFGKTMAADMICAYYDREADSGAMFKKTKLRTGPHSDQPYPWDVYLGQFDVIRIVMTDFIKEDIPVPESLSKLASRILEELNEVYPEVKYDPDDFYFSLEKYYRKTNRQFVIVIDEWDAVFRIRKEDHTGQTKYLDFLRDWMKDKT